MKRNMKKMAAGLLSGCMLMGSAMTALAADGEINAPIYSFDVVDVIVPTTYAVAFNPEGLQVESGGTTVTDQILSKNFGIINKSNKDKLITVSLTVEDENANSGITFVDSASDVDNAADGEYKIHLTLIPADATEVKVGETPAIADKDTTAAELGAVSMTKAADSTAVTLKAGANKVGFKLDKATYAPKQGSEVTLGTTDANNVAANYEIASLATGGKGITAFTFSGKMNEKADWFKLTEGIKITPVYSSKTVPTGTSVLTGTGAMVTLTGTAPSVTTTDFNIMEKDKDVELTVNLGSGDFAATTVKSVTWTGTEFLNNGVTFDSANNKVIIAASNINYLLDTASASKDFVITFDEGTSVTVTLGAKTVTP